MLLYISVSGSMPNFQLSKFQLSPVGVGNWELGIDASLSNHGLRLVAPPHQANHGQLDDENHECRPDHRANRRGNVFRLHVYRIPEGQASLAPALAGEPVPD